eukprot:m.352223 g.352223  ORF g.352223 m.352223 type:complete len:293 (-) comp19901_c0_seq5:632-1510(-)
MPTKADLVAKGFMTASGDVVQNTYYIWYGGDYDSAAWLYGQLKQHWDDPARGTVPIGWAVDSELSLRFPVIYKYLYATRTANDVFTSGDSGAGYLNPTNLVVPRDSGLPSADQVWNKWNTKWFQKFGLSFTGFVIDGNMAMNSTVENIYSSFSFNGIVEQRPANYHLNDDVPILHHASDVIQPDAASAGKGMCQFFKANTTNFIMFRTILRQASFMANASKAAAALCPGLKVVSPHEASYLARVAGGSDNDNMVWVPQKSWPRLPVFLKLLLFPKNKWGSHLGFRWSSPIDA